MPRRNYSFAEIKRRESFLESLNVTETLAKEKIALADLLEQETDMEFEQAAGIIDDMCAVLLPGHRGVARLKVFRELIRDSLKNEFIDYDESVDHSETISDARHAGCP